MNEDLAFVDKHRNKGALVDANLLLVYVVGLADKNNLVRNPHTKQYALEWTPRLRQPVNRQVAVR